MMKAKEIKRSELFCLHNLLNKNRAGVIKQATQTS